MFQCVPALAYIITYMYTIIIFLIITATLIFPHVVEYKKDLSPDSSYALLKQQIPKSFLQLQERVSDLVKGFNEKQRPPYLSHEEFSSNFLSIFDNDEEEMNEAVNYLTLQGTCVHV